MPVFRRHRRRTALVAAARALAEDADRTVMAIALELPVIDPVGGIAWRAACPSCRCAGAVWSAVPGAATAYAVTCPRCGTHHCAPAGSGGAS